ncbi:MAG TPA: zf-HC2 domain-containing protein [Planctomycetes bacterium]|nr:zf-HC2 domain-containing protein [Planctomycetaceae bacterium]HIN54063.1 zf-HC2 domain-containing protein [Planctomycetota bacterium]
MNDHIKPNHEIDGELLSAYLDDELTASERAVVEQAIENSPPLRESLQELKVLSNEIQCLAVEFHPNEQQLLDAVITKIRDRNLSVHGQAPYSNVKIPVMARDWKQRLQIPALLALTAGVLAVLTLQFMPNEQSMTLVQTDLNDATPAIENFQRAENTAPESEAVTDHGPPMGGMGGGRDAFADTRFLQEDQKYRDKNLAEGESATADDPAAPADIRASSFPSASTVADSADEMQLHKQAEAKTDVADVTYHIQVKQTDLPTLLALLTAHQNLAQNARQRKAIRPANGEKNIAEESPPRVATNEPMENSVRKSTVNQIVMFRSNSSQLAALVDILQKKPTFALSMNRLQRGALGDRLMAKNKDAPGAEVKNQSASAVLSDTIFSIQVIATP